MTATLIPGAPVADAVLAEVAERAAKLATSHRKPGLATILVGDDAASAGYVSKKHETSEKLGLLSVDVRIPGSATQKDLLEAVEALNKDDKIDAFIIQNPVPAGFDFNEAMAAVDPAKDADGLHPTNLGFLALGEKGRPRPCTPLGIQAMLVHYGIPVSGKRVVIVGRGPTLGRPLSMLLALKEPGANAAVTVVHTGVPDWKAYAREADILIGAAGVHNIVGPDAVKPGACVISGGISWEGRKLLPDVSEDCAEVAGWITPRLGGVGVTTVAMLLRNTVGAAERRAGL